MTTRAHDRRHLRRGVPQHLRRGADHRPRSHLARPRRRQRHRQRVEQHPLRLRSRPRSLRHGHSRWPTRRRRPVPCAALPQGPGRGARTLAPRPAQSKRADLSDDGVLQPSRRADVLQAGPEDRVLRRRLPVPRRTLRPPRLGDPDPLRRIRARSPLRLPRRPDGGQSLVPRHDRRRRPGSRDPGRRRREHGRRRHPAVPRRPGRERLEGGEPVQVHDREHLRRILPDAADDAGRQVEGARRSGVDPGDHHQRPRPADDREGDAGRDRRVGRDAGVGDDLRRQLRRPARQELRLSASREAAGLSWRLSAIVSPTRKRGTLPGRWRYPTCSGPAISNASSKTGFCRRPGRPSLARSG